MMKRVLACTAACLAIGGVSASARDLTLTIQADKRTLISSFAMFDSESCTSGEIPVGRAVVAPRNGKIEILEERRTVDADNCGRIQGWARNVYFTPAKGFRGIENVRIDFQYNKWTDAPALVTQTDNITLIVK